jgi:hypothetical protein
VSPADLLARLDAEAGEHERRALACRSVADQLRDLVAEAIALIGSPSPVEAPPARDHPPGWMTLPPARTSAPA